MKNRVTGSIPAKVEGNACFNRSKIIRPTMPPTTKMAEFYKEEREQSENDADNQAHEPQPVRDRGTLGAKVRIRIIYAHKKAYKNKITLRYL